MSLDLAWMTDGLCAGMCSGWDALEVAEQISMCGGCPVAVECRDYGQAVDAADIVYGGRLFPPHSRKVRVGAQNVCAGPDCERAVSYRATGLCRTHQAQWVRRGRSRHLLTPIGAAA